MTRRYYYACISQIHQQLYNVVMLFPSQQQLTLCQPEITNTEDNSPGTAASDTNRTGVIIGSVLGVLAVLILSAILALQLIRILRQKRRHLYAIQGMPYNTVGTIPYWALYTYRLKVFTNLYCVYYTQEQVKETQMWKMKHPCTGKQV